MKKLAWAMFSMFILGIVMGIVGLILTIACDGTIGVTILLLGIVAGVAGYYVLKYIGTRIQKQQQEENDRLMNEILEDDEDDEEDEVEEDYDDYKE